MPLVKHCHFTVDAQLGQGLTPDQGGLTAASTVKVLTLGHCLLS